MTSRSWTRSLPWMTAFAVAMAFLESAVVIDLRELYYPAGFAFPMAPLNNRIAVTELVREFCTLVMLLAPGALLSKRRLERFAWFCYCFAVWDIFYYVFLKVILGWPESVFTWDILFLLPVVWVGPVLAPCLVSMGLITLASVLLHRRASSALFRPAPWHWLLLILSGSLVLWTFVEEPCRQLRRNGDAATSSADAFFALRKYIPEHYAWTTFLLAFCLGSIAVAGMARRPA